MAIPSRKQWQEFRDKNTVPKGAGKGSVGDLLDKIEKSLANLKSDKDRTNAVKLLDKSLGDAKKYKESVAKKFKDFAPKLDKFLLDPIAEEKKHVEEFAANVKHVKTLAMSIPTLIESYRSANRKSDKAAVVKTRAAMVEMLKKLAPEVNKCAKLDAPHHLIWTNISKYCSTGAVLAKDVDKDMEKYQNVKAGTDEETKLRTHFSALVDECVDNLNKIVAAVNPLIMGA